MATSDSKPRAASLLNSGTSILKKLVFDEIPENQEHRREERQPVAGEVIVVELGENDERTASHRVFIRDLSKSGCGLWCRAKLNQGAKIAVVFQDAEGVPVQRIATVCHCRGQQSTGFAVGVRFTGPKQPVPKPS